MTEEERSVIAQLFSKFHVTLKDAWLNDVLAYLHVERTDTDPQTITQLVYEQWLYSELSYSTRPTIRLPPFAKKSFLDKDVVVQINWLVDVHSSMYSKLREYTKRGIDNSGFSWEPNSETQDPDPTNRMLLMEITDGQRKLRAIEYLRIVDLCTKLLPGTKLLISRGTTSRCNVLLLTPSNVTVLGGESEICQRNAPALVLARRLGINEEKLKAIEECEIIEGRSMETEKPKAKKADFVAPSGPVRKNITAKSIVSEQSSGAKKGKKSIVFSRTITSYFKPERKSHETNSKESMKAQGQQSGLNREIKLEPCTDQIIAPHIPAKPGEKNSELGKSSSSFSEPIASSKKQAQLPASTNAIPSSKTEPHGEISVVAANARVPEVQPDSPTLASRTQCIRQILADSETHESTAQNREESMTVVLCPESSLQNITASVLFGEQIREKTMLLPARLQHENPNMLSEQLTLATTDKNLSLRVQKMNYGPKPTALSGENQQRTGTNSASAQSLIPVWATDVPPEESTFDKDNAIASSRTLIIPSSSIQEPMAWAAFNRRRCITADVNSTQFLANEFCMPTAATRVEAQTTEISDVQMANSVASNHGPPEPQNLLQNTLQRRFTSIASNAANIGQASLINTQREQPSLEASGSAAESHAEARYDPRFLHVAPGGRNSRPGQVAQSAMVSQSFQHDPLQAAAATLTNQNSRVSCSTAAQQPFPGLGMAPKGTAVVDRPATLVLPDSTLQIIPYVNVVARYHALNIVSIREACNQRKYCLIVHRKRVQPIFCKLHAGLQFVGQNWTAALRIADETCEALDCLVDSDAITRLIGFTPQEAQQAAAANDRVRVAYFKGRAQALLEIFKRIDLILTIEFSSSPDVLPLVVDITNLSAALHLC